MSLRFDFDNEWLSSEVPTRSLQEKRCRLLDFGKSLTLKVGMKGV